MYAPATGDPARKGREGSALVASLVVFVAVAGLVVATTRISSVEIAASRRSIDDVRAAALAEAGVEHTKAVIKDAMDKTAVLDPLDGVRALFGGADEISTFDAQPLISSGAIVGEYTVSMALNSDSANRTVVTVTSTGYVPRAPENLRPGERLESWDSIDVTLELALQSSSVFDNAYFINNWGWLYGSTIEVGGNARSNGQMDIGGHSPTIGGSPIYDEVEFDGTDATVGERSSDGGLFSGWDIVNAHNAQGMAADSDHHYDFEEAVTMPNLTDLTLYEERAVDAGASISIGGSMVADAIAGDGAGESENLYLEGTFANPIELNGPIVVRGDVIIKGYITGQGAIYAGGNVYVPDSIEYLDGPSSTRPAGSSDADYEAWLSANWDKDFLGLFAREHIVVGDYTNTYWERYVDNWMSSSLNSSAEDAGEDQIPNTAAGRDGILGTADDDVLEGDGIFSVETYSALDEAQGLIPDGFSVGDVIPGSGEDIDGDGQYDGQTSVADLAIDSALDPAFWDGNMPAAGIGAYSDIASLYANRLDGTFYTNQSFSWVVFGSQDAQLNGSMVARNENIVYGTPSIEMNHDARLLGGASGYAGDLLPMIAAPIEVLQWRRNDEDPHRAAVTP